MVVKPMPTFLTDVKLSVLNLSILSKNICEKVDFAKRVVIWDIACAMAAPMAITPQAHLLKIQSTRLAFFEFFLH